MRGSRNLRNAVSINWNRGAFRVWVLISLAWIMACALYCTISNLGGGSRFGSRHFSCPPGCSAGHRRVWRNTLFAPSKASFRFPRSKLLCAVKNSPGVRQRMKICIAPRDRSVQRRIRFTHSIEIALTLVIALTPFVKTLDGRKWRRCSTIPVRFRRFSRSSTSDGRAGTVPESKICRTISGGRLSTSASARAACSGTCCEILGATALSAAALFCSVLWGFFLDRLGNGLLVASGLVRFLELV
jgi:hypothetical protein